MAIRVFVDGVDRSDYRHAASSLSWSDQLNGRGTLQVTFRDVWNGWRPEAGEELLVTEGEDNELRSSDSLNVRASGGEAIVAGPDRLFGGFLTNPSEREELGSDYLFHDCAAVEFSALCDRRIVTRVYENETVDEIVRDIVAQDLAGEGVWDSGVINGPLVDKAVFPDVSVTEALNELAELVGFAWRIDQYKVLHFGPRDSETGPAVDGDVALAGTVVVSRSQEKYRNVQIVRAGRDLTDERTETVVGDGQRRVFGLAFPIGAVPTVEVSRTGAAWVEETVGILGVEQGKAWYWNEGQAQVSQSDSGTLLAAPSSSSDPTTGDRVRVTYQGQFPLKTQYQDLDEIAARAAIEGSSGIYTHVEDRPQISSAQSALDAAVGLIDRYGSITATLEFVTRLATFVPGQLVAATFPRHNLNGDELLVESVQAAYNDEEGAVWYSVRALAGAAFGGWQDYFRMLIRGGKSLVVGREGEVLVLTRSSPEGVEVSDSVAVDDTQPPEDRVGIMLVGIGEIGS